MAKRALVPPLSTAARIAAVAGLSLLATGAFGSLAIAQTPTGEHIVSGSGSISSSGVTMNVPTSGGVIRWDTFNVGAGNTVRFYQPSAGSAALNRIMQPPTAVLGPVAPSSAILATPEMPRAAPGADGRGAVAVRLGTATIGGQETLTVDPHGDNLLRYDTGIAPKATDQAGATAMTARDLNGVARNLVNTGGAIEARTATVAKGVVVLGAPPDLQVGPGAPLPGTSADGGTGISVLGDQLPARSR